jgi:curved DNA-binding protein
VVEMMGQVQALPVPFLEALRGGKVKLPSGIVLGDVPPGTQTGDLLTFVNPKNHDGPPISMRVTVLSHPSLTRIGNNLAMLLPVTLAEAYRGGPITISGPWGNLDFRLPQGIHHGEKRRLAGHGVRVPGRPPGDLVVEIVLVYPAAGDEALEAALARLQGDWSPRAPV